MWSRADCVNPAVESASIAILRKWSGSGIEAESRDLHLEVTFEDESTLLQFSHLAGWCQDAIIIIAVPVERLRVTNFGHDLREVFGKFCLD